MQPIVVVILIAVVLFAISFHESAHAWTALKFGDPTARDLGRISLNPLHHIDPFGTVLLPMIMILMHQPPFGYAKPTPVNLRNTRNPRLANFWVSAAGPLSNLLVVTVSAALLVAIGRYDRSLVVGAFQGPTGAGVLAPVSYILAQLVLLNLVLGVFNLIPVPPMDGSGILFSILGRRGLAIEMFFHRYSFVMFLIIMLLVYSGFFGLILGPAIRIVLSVIERGIG
ncbi:MAG TPA: site-2 protease family protein [Thermoanaerobaculia bacterium]|nr:site-2 protease family protein [Thermoanaerobaculia bacterium]